MIRTPLVASHGYDAQRAGLVYLPPGARAAQHAAGPGIGKVTHMSDETAEAPLDVTVVDCLFCRVVAHEVPAEVVVEGEAVLAFRDIDPQAPTHVLVVPRSHHRDVGALAEGEPETLVELVAVARRVATSEGHEDFRLVFNTGSRSGQSVFHVHAHVLAGRDMTWPPG